MSNKEANNSCGAMIMTQAKLKSILVEADAEFTFSGGPN